MLIQRGKAEGWLTLSAEATKEWAAANGIAFINASPAVIPGRGTGLVADRDLSSPDSSQLAEILTTDEDLVLSVETVKKHALFDKDLRELLDCLGDFGRTSRGAILSFLLFQVSVACPLLSARVGVHGPFTDYVKTLPCESLPIFWTPDELKLLVGTTLAPAVSAKLKSLRREYDLVCDSANSTRWYQTVEPFLDFGDWMHVDAMFRSRALDFHGSCMIPGMDLASHAAGERTNAFYDRTEGQYNLWLCTGKSLSKGDEVAITYGDEKGACEMVFSYGFLEEHMDTAETLFLSLAIPDDDTTKTAKLRIADCAPGFKIIDIANESDNEAEGQIDWKGDFVWLLCVSLDDGFRLEIANTVDGSDQELHAFFQDQELSDGAKGLRRALAQSPLWDVFHLRAIVILQNRVFDQLQLLHSTQEQIERTLHDDVSGIQSTAMRLRTLEFELLEKAYEDFERQKVTLAQSPVVQKYLSEVGSPKPE